MTGTCIYDVNLSFRCVENSTVYRRRSRHSSIIILIEMLMNNRTNINDMIENDAKSKLVHTTCTRLIKVSIKKIVF